MCAFIPNLKDRVFPLENHNQSFLIIYHPTLLLGHRTPMILQRDWA